MPKVEEKGAEERRMKEYILTEEDLSSMQLLLIDSFAEVIRCKECKHWNEDYRECQSPNWDTGTDGYFVTPAGFYCRWAKRKEE